MEYRCEDLCKRYGGKTVLDGVRFALRAGERLCVVAPSGGGKTTLLRLLAGLEPPDGGRLIGFPEAKLAMAFQEPRLCEHRSAVTNVAMVRSHPDRAAIAQALREMLPDDCLTQPVRELSVGMRRRVEVARAVLSDAQVLLLDEPFAGLDGESRDKTARFILDRAQNRALICTAHAVEEAAWLAAETLVLPGTI